MNVEKVVHFVRQFVPLEESILESMLPILSQVELKKNEIWQAEGVMGTSMGFINKGIMRLYFTDDGEEFTQEFYAENEFASNFISYVKKQPSKTAIQALEPCELIVMQLDDLQNLYDEVPALDRFGRLYAEQMLIGMYDKMNAILGETPEQRYYKLLDSKPDIFSRVKQYYIAQYLGIRPESLSRIRKRHMESS